MTPTFRQSMERASSRRVSGPNLCGEDMKFVMVAAAAGTALVLAGCEQPSEPQVETAPPPMEVPVAPAATDQAAPTAATAPANTAPPATTLPADQRSSEQSVQPESETLFY